MVDLSSTLIEAAYAHLVGTQNFFLYIYDEPELIAGVLDGAFFHVEDARVSRVAACVVAPQLTAARLIEELRQRIDPVFLPRPLLRQLVAAGYEGRKAGRGWHRYDKANSLGRPRWD